VGEFVLPDKSASANRVVANGKILASLGYHTLFLGASDTHEEFSGIRAVNDQIDMYEQAHPNTSLQWIKHIFSTRNVEQLVKQSDAKMVIAYNLSFITFLRLKSRFHKKGIRVAYDCTEWTGHTSGSFLKKVFKKVDEWFIRNLLPFVCADLIVVSRTMAKKYKRCKNLILIPPLVDIQDALWHQSAVDHGDIFEFCFSGSLDGNKERLDCVVEGFSQIDEQDIRLRIVGMTKEEFLQAYPVQQNNIQDDRMIFMGRVSHEDSVKYILNSDCYIFVRPSDRRNQAGFPTKFVESFTCGVPVVTTDVSDVARYYTKEDHGILLKKFSNEKIRDAMFTQINKGKRKNIGQMRMDFDIRNYKSLFDDFMNK
jgi:glycosyltransferase involved in cell wall biosynthesis